MPQLAPSQCVQSLARCLLMNTDNPVFPHSSICCHGNGACGDRRVLFIVPNLGSHQGISTGRNTEMEENKA